MLEMSHAVVRVSGRVLKNFGRLSTHLSSLPSIFGSEDGSVVRTFFPLWITTFLSRTMCNTRLSCFKQRTVHLSKTHRHYPQFDFHPTHTQHNLQYQQNLRDMLGALVGMPKVERSAGALSRDRASPVFSEDRPAIQAIRKIYDMVSRMIPETTFYSLAAIKATTILYR